MSLKKENILDQLSELENQIPDKNTSPNEERAWISRVKLFCQYVNMHAKIPEDLANLIAHANYDNYKHPDLESERDVIAPYPGEEAIRQDIKKHKREGRKEFFKRYRTFLEDSFKYSSNFFGSSQNTNTRGWSYISNGSDAWLNVNGIFFPLTDPAQNRGDNISIHLLDLLAFPERIGKVLSGELKTRLESLNISVNKTTFNNAVSRINQIVGKSKSGKKFLKFNANKTSCEIDYAFIDEFNISK